jgi:pyruvate formate lyase activating enzyme
MSDSADLTGAERRKFLKDCLYGTGAAFCGFGHVDFLTGKPEVAPDQAQKQGGRKEALYYRSAGSQVTCAKCPNGCILEPGESGLCRNRVNDGGKLYAVGYGKPCAVHIDPVEKKPFFHFLPTTKAFSVAIAGCNLRCLNCQNWEISQVSPDETSNYDLMPHRAVEECLASRSASIAYTYSEPTTFYEYVLDTGALARKRKIKNLLKSNGYINEEPLRRLCKVLDAANIDLKSFDDATYRKLSSATLEPVLRTLNVLREEGVWLEITNLVIPGWTDDLAMIRRMCQWLVANGLSGPPLHFSRFSPLFKLTHLPATPVSVLEKARAIALESGVKYAYVGNVPGHEFEHTYCHGCGKRVIERRGYTVGENRLVSGKCGYCGVTVPGVWV